LKASTLNYLRKRMIVNKTRLTRPSIGAATLRVITLKILTLKTVKEFLGKSIAKTIPMFISAY